MEELVDIMEQTVLEAYNYAKQWLGSGKSAVFIPELTKEDPRKLGVCVTNCRGEVFAVGDCSEKFTIQSIAKLLLLAVAVRDSGSEKVFSKVGVEQCGETFNSVYHLELVDPKPSNPFINAGAIAVSDCITGCSVEEKAEKVYELAAACLGTEEVGRSEAVFQCESETGYRNVALAGMMKYDKVLEGRPEDCLAVYYHACSILADCRMLSHFGAVLACGGKEPGTGKIILDEKMARLLRVLMAGCGLYNRTGDFAVRVGIPAKSGSAGGIMAAVPGKLGIGTFSPLLDDMGNSVCGFKALEYLSSKCGLSIY